MVLRTVCSCIDTLYHTNFLKWATRFFFCNFSLCHTWIAGMLLIEAIDDTKHEVEDYFTVWIVHARSWKHTSHRVNIVKKEMCLKYSKEWKDSQSNSKKESFLKLTDFIFVHRIHTVFIRQRSAVNNSQKGWILTYRHQIHAWLIKIRLSNLIKLWNLNIITKINKMTGLHTEEFDVLLWYALGWLVKKNKTKQILMQID